MAKHHDIVWHKRREKFIPAKLQKAPSSSVPAPSTEAQEKALNRKEQFLKHLSLEIRKAVRKS
ncbi:MAG TPA: hypothetical protein P5246_07900 [Candidatus Omnitrophota bacterium]|jgi:hypothetical protein|nr:hypothetical protein [Candidatus Omnitrophota bacterium]HSA30592.1 hypothetical protein [Candidatus Omnitrophota bacterium]